MSIRQGVPGQPSLDIPKIGGKMKHDQTEIDFYKGQVKIVRNWWAEVYHVQDINGFTVAKAHQPHIFDSKDDAKKWAEGEGFEVIGQEYSKCE